MLNSLCKLRPFKSFISQSRFVRPIVKLGKDKFQLSIDVRQFDKDELRVKARKEFIVIEGKQERQMQNGYVVRRFVRKYKLPSGCDPQKVQSTISEDGILTVTAPREVSDVNMPSEIPVPIKSCRESNKDDPECSQIEEPKKEMNLCDYYLKKDQQDKCEPPKPPECK